MIIYTATPIRDIEDKLKAIQKRAEKEMVAILTEEVAGELRRVHKKFGLSGVTFEDGSYYIVRIDGEDAYGDDFGATRPRGLQRFVKLCEMVCEYVGSIDEQYVDEDEEDT